MQNGSGWKRLVDHETLVLKHLEKTHIFLLRKSKLPCCHVVTEARSVRWDAATRARASRVGAAFFVLWGSEEEDRQELFIVALMEDSFQVKPLNH